MGLGKTIQVITFLASKLEKNRNLKILIVMPKILLENWNNELNKFIPTLIEDNVYIHQGAKREKQREKLMDYTFVLTTYETLARDQVLLGSILWNIMICDEVQKIKNFNTLAASAVKGMNTEFKIAMTGTPVENRLSDLWSIVDYILPGYLSSYSEFKKNYEIPIGNRDIEAENELIQKLNPIFFRRMKEEVLIQELPQKHEEKLYVSAVSAERRMYQEILQEYKEQEKKEPLKALNNLIMASSHPQLVRNERTSDRKLVKESSKLNRTIRLLNQIKFKGEKVLIFTRYREMQKILQRIIYAKFKILPSIINGQMAAGMDKYEVIKEFERVKGFNVLILSPKAAGVGLTITAANHVIHYTREWNPAIENQATDRIYRIGQKKEVHVYYLITEYEDIYTVDRKLDNLLEYKKELLRRIIVPENLTVTENDLLEVIGF
jgi:SNF2 family DNA or RNA helicase